MRRKPARKPPAPPAHTYGIVVDARDVGRANITALKPDEKPRRVRQPASPPPPSDEPKPKNRHAEATVRQKVFLRAIAECTVSDKGPSFRKVQVHMGLKSVRAVQKAVIALKRKGLVDSDTSRDHNGIAITERGQIVLRIFLRSAEAFDTISEDNDEQ